MITNKKKISKKKKVLISIILVVLLLFVYSIVNTNVLSVTNITYSNAQIPASFDGYKIVQISDLHNKRFGKNQSRLINLVKKNSPDVIFVTGDLIDRRNTNLVAAMEFIDEAVKIAPVYYVSGNHEAWSQRYDQLKTQLLNSGVIVMDDTDEYIQRGDESIHLIGLSDPAFINSTKKIGDNIEALSKSEEFEMLLMHRPELFEIYVEKNMDLVFSGHAHGGQIRLPIIGPIVAPNQGLFPEYTMGTYEKNGTTMVVSRGLGNSVIPLRTLNSPEIIALTLSVD